MNRRVGNDGGGEPAVTRRDVLKIGLGLGAASLTVGISTPTAAPAPAGAYGGHVNILNVGYPEVWDPHIAGTIGANAAVSPLYNQVVEFNPIKPTRRPSSVSSPWTI
jgi:hypothetical protein